MSSFQVGPETFFAFTFQVFDADGEAVGEAEVMEAIFGMGQLLPRVEGALSGLGEGANFEVRLAPQDAFGRRRAEAILEVDRADFPADVAVGDRFEVENADGGLLVVQILDVGQDYVVIDTNHPLSDQTITVRGRVLAVRPASLEELEHAVRALEEDQAYFEQPAPDVSVSSLLRPTGRG